MRRGVHRMAAKDAYTFARLCKGLRVCRLANRWPLAELTTFFPVRNCTMDDITRLADVLGRHLESLKAQVSTAESCTGGGIAEAITRIGGSSAWFEAGYVTYSNAQKTRQLDVPQALFESVGAVSEEVVRAMATGAQRHSGARFAVSVSGVAGPSGGSPQKPVGTVWLCWADGQQVIAQRHHFAGDRDEVRRQTVKTALEGLIQLCIGEKPKQG